MMAVRQVHEPSHHSRMHRSSIHEDTLVQYDVPYAVDPTNDGFFLIYCEMDQRYTGMLLKHSRQVLERRRLVVSRTRSTPPSASGKHSGIEGFQTAASGGEYRSASVGAHYLNQTGPQDASTSKTAKTSSSDLGTHDYSGRSRSRSLTPIYPKVHRDYVHEKSLRYFEIPYKWDPDDPAFFVLLQEMTQGELETLFEHTYQLRVSTVEPEYAQQLPLTRIDSPFDDEFGVIDSAGERVLDLRRVLEESIEPAVRCFQTMPPRDDERRTESRQWLEDMILEGVMKPMQEIDVEAGGESEYLKKDLLYDCTSILCQLDAHL